MVIVPIKHLLSLKRPSQTKHLFNRAPKMAHLDIARFITSHGQMKN